MISNVVRSSSTSPNSFWAWTLSSSRALNSYWKKRIVRTSIIQIVAQLGCDLFVDFDKRMTIPLIGPFFLFMTQVSMPFVLRFLYASEILNYTKIYI